MRSLCFLALAMLPALCANAAQPFPGNRFNDAAQASNQRDGVVHTDPSDWPVWRGDTTAGAGFGVPAPSREVRGLTRGQQLMLASLNKPHRCAVVTIETSDGCHHARVAKAIPALDPKLIEFLPR